jgi:hypothetical protein
VGLGLIATNTIAQGDTRRTGLASLEAQNATIYRVENDTRWPGTAAVVVSIIHIYKGDYQATRSLNNRAVRFISSQLDEREVIGDPFRLIANKNKSFIGSFVNGMGFILDPIEANILLARGKYNQDVIFPYLSGQDLNSDPEQKPSRWIINFFDWPRERTLKGRWTQLSKKAQAEALRTGIVPPDYPGPVAMDYPDCYDIVKERVYPVRAKVRRQAHRAYWWHYGDKRPALYSTIAQFKRVLVQTLHTKYLAPSFTSNGTVYSHALTVFASDTWETYSIIQSTLHEVWVRERSSSLGQTLRYSPTDCYETFPHPSKILDLDTIGAIYYEHRRQIMLERQEGLTTTYNRFHEPQDTAQDNIYLRQLHIEVDNAVAAAYGWQDLDLGYGFHETAQGIRYTVSEPARRELLTRLLKLNHERYAEEVRLGLHEKKQGRKGAKGQAVAERSQSGSQEKGGKDRKKKNDGQMSLL